MNKFLKRMREIKVNRKTFVNENNDIKLLNPEEFINAAKDNISERRYFTDEHHILWCDNPLCAFFGFCDVDGKEYYCPIEDLSDGQIETIEKLKGMYH